LLLGSLGFKLVLQLLDLGGFLTFYRFNTLLVLAILFLHQLEEILLFGLLLVF
jgi:hypothetical protein